MRLSHRRKLNLLLKLQAAKRRIFWRLGALRKGDTASAVCLFADMVADPAHNYRVNPAMRSSPEKLASAANIATDMVKWREGKGLEAFEVHTVS